MLDYLLGRDSAVSSGHDEAERIEAEIARRMADYDQKLAAARAEVAAIHASKRAEAQDADAAARTEADAKIAAAVG